MVLRGISAHFVLAASVTGAVIALKGCATPAKPTQQMIFASAALKAAERVQAERRSPDLFRRAENAYWKAKRYYLSKDYREADLAAVETRRLAEQAEMDSDLKDSLSSNE